MLKYLFAALLNAVRGIARTFGYELKIVLTDHKILLKFDNPDREGSCWDKSHWTYGNIFIEGYANPVKPSITEDDKTEMITSDRYKTFMEQSLIDDMLQASKSKGLTLLQAVIAIVSLQVATILAMVWLTGGV
jgi:hypothetical protein